MRRVIIAITGASGVIYGIRALELLRQIDDVESHAIITPSAYRTALAEVDYTPDQIKLLADQLYNHKDIGAAISELEEAIKSDDKGDIEAKSDTPGCAATSSS